VVALRVLPGPREDWFDAEALEVLTGSEYRVTPASNRTGLRLAGPALGRVRAGELPSEGMVTGAIQVPPDGQPILLLADHPVTGGYPVIGVVVTADLGQAAQLRPGQPVRFTLAGRPGLG
jgi:allophanate hydrolase subunit 2